MTLDEFMTRSRRFLSKKRRTSSVKALHRFATFIEDAYENDDLDMCVNGEANLVRRLRLAPFATVFDVGAHVGDWSKEALAAWPNAHVHAFEVAPATFDRLKQRVSEAGLSDRVTLNGVGMSDTTGTREMFYFPEHPDLTCDIARHPAYRSTPFLARLVAGDDYVAERGIANIDFVKIDVEGAEHLVLKGLRRTIEANRIQCVQFEMGAFSIQTRVLLADFYDMLGGRYWIGKIFPTHVEFRDYHWTMESFRFSNFACVLRTRPDLKALAEGALEHAGSFTVHA